MEIRMEAARYLSIVKRWWWLLIVGTLMSVAAYGIASRIRDRAPASPEFSASTTLFVSDRRWYAEAAASAAASAGASDRLVRVVRGDDQGTECGAADDQARAAVFRGDVQRSIDVTTPPGTQLIQSRRRRAHRRCGAPGDGRRAGVHHAS
jgi:hypothetical protein